MIFLFSAECGFPLPLFPGSFNAGATVPSSFNAGATVPRSFAAGPCDVSALAVIPKRETAKACSPADRHFELGQY